MMSMPSSSNSDEEEAMCRRSAHDYDLYARTRSRPTPVTSKPARSLVEVLRDLFRPRRPQVQEAEVVPFPGAAAPSGDRVVEHEGPRAA
jgi:hypothetical protein